MKVTVIVPTAAVDAVIQAVQDDRDEHGIRDAIWCYDGIIAKALALFGPPRENREARRHFLIQVQAEAERRSSGRGSWDAADIVRNSLNGTIAYMTPGFLEARRYHDQHGS